MKVYGIKSCDSVKKGLSYLQKRGLKYEFIDLKTTPLEPAQLERWISEVGMERVLNTKGTKYKTLGLSKMALDEAGKKEWLRKEPLLIKRPVIECDSGRVLVGFDEEMYQRELG